MMFYSSVLSSDLPCSIYVICIGLQLGLLSANVRVMDTSSKAFGAVIYYPAGAPMLVPGFYWNSF